MSDTWIIPPSDPGDPSRMVTITAAAGPLLIELVDFDGFVTAKEARRISFALQQAAHELDGIEVLGEDPA